VWKPRSIPGFAPFLSASALAAADVLGGFAFGSDTENQTKSHRVAVSRSDFRKGLRLRRSGYGATRGAEPNTKDSREKAQEAQERESPFAAFATFRGHSVGGNRPSQRSQSNSVKVGQTDLRKG
jgi:hypothetical protein